VTPAGDGGPLAARHHRVQKLRRLLRRRSARSSEGAFVLEGEKLLAEALDAHAPLEAVYCAFGTSPSVADEAAKRGIRVFELAPGVLERVAETTTPQPVLAVCGRIDVELEKLPGDGVIVVCVDVRDPGNLGTVLRSAEASGAAGVVCCDGSVDVYSPKCVRASAGALFHTLVVARGDPHSVLETLGSWGMRRLGARRHGGTSYERADLRPPAAIVLGNESHGLGPELEPLLDGWVTIPMEGRSESLNVSMAGAVLCFEAARQRRG
jgi:TrmH family RNA methyltransferase